MIMAQKCEVGNTYRRLGAYLKSEGEARMRNHKDGSRKSHRRRFFSPFSTLICTLFRACGLVMGTGDEDCPEALLAWVDTALADLVVLAAAVLPQEESPFQPPLLDRKSVV